MRLAEFILSNLEAILVEWEEFARTIWPGNASTDPATLRDHAEELLLTTASDMGANQSTAQQSAKSKGKGDQSDESERVDRASVAHGAGRHESGFDLTAVIAEYRALRASVIRLWRESDPAPDLRDLKDLTRFNEAIDQSLTEAVIRFTQLVDQERHEREQTLREREERLRLAAEVTGFGTYDYDVCRNEVNWSKQLRTIIHLPDEARISPETSLSQVHPDDRERFQRMVDAALDPNGLGRHEFEFRTISTDGQVRWLRDVGQTQYEGEGKSRRAVRVIGTVQDITERKLAEQALHESEQRLQIATAAADLGTWDWDLGTDRAIRSLRHDQMFGYRELQPAWGLAIAERHVLPEDLPAFRAAVKRALETGEMHLETRVRWPDGTIHWIAPRGRVHYDSDGRPIRVVGVVADITERKRNEEELRRNAAIIEGITRGTDELIAAQDADYRYLYFNDAYQRTFESLWGKPLRIGMSMLNVLADWPEELEKAKALWSRAQSGESFNVTMAFGPNEAAARIFDLRFNPVLNIEGRQIGAAHIIRDVTDQIRTQEALRESEERFRAFAKATSEVIYRMNADWSEMRLLEGREFIDDMPEPSRTWLNKYIHPDDQQHVLERIREAIETKGAFELEHRVFRTDGSLGWTLSRAVPIFDARGEIVEWFGAASDITSRKQAEQALRESDRRKDEFLAMLSHELRNPLATIRSALHLLKLEEKSASESATQHQTRAVMERQVTNLTKLVNDLLEVSRVVTGQIRLDRQIVNLNQVIRHAVETATPLIEHRRHTLSVTLCPEPAWCEVDATRIEEVFVNLLNNAAKYTPDGGQIEVQCEHPEGSDRVLVRVRDNGTGIDPELRPHIFELFTQADRSMARSAGGLGVGLSLSRRLVELHGGSIEAVSPPPGRTVGSEFIVHLPATVAPRPVQSRSPEPPIQRLAQAEALRVLVVDDSIDAAKMLATLLRHLGYDVQSAYDGREGLKLALHWQPDVVLLDIGLPGLDGYEVARLIRSDPGMRSARQRMRLIALTGYGRESDIAQAFDAGFDAHLVKPVDFDKLEELLAMGTRASV